MDAPLRVESGETLAVVVPFSQVRHSEAWRSWATLTEHAPPFLAPEFFALTQRLATAGEPLVAEAWRGGVLEGVLPLELTDHTLLALRSSYSPGFDYRGSVRGLDAVWELLRRDSRWDVMVLKNVPAESLLATRLLDLAHRDGCPAVVRPGARHAFFALAGFESKLSAKFLTNLRRCARKAGGVELERITAVTHADFQDALAIEAMAWKGAARTGIANDPQAAHLYDAMLRLFGSRGRAQLSFLRVAGQRIAMLLSVEDDHTLFALKIGYDPRFVALSPGHLMVWQVALDAERRGIAVLDFVGREDEWKRKWTDRIHQHVSVMVYRRSPRGLLLYGAREAIKPLLPGGIRDPGAPLRRGCQRADKIGDHSLAERAVGRLALGLGIRSGIRRLLAPPPVRTEREGTESQFATGSWVRVLDEDRVLATLDAHSRLRGLSFVPSQWQTCGKVYRVQKQVRRLRDDQDKMRAVARTVLLQGATCAGDGSEPAGCGRHCPLMYRDEWLEAAEPPRREPPGPAEGRPVRVREVEEIRAGLNVLGRRDGLSFMPQMADFAGKRQRVAGRLSRVFEYDRWVETRRPIYILEGLHCDGTALGPRGPCDRACALLWHEDWLLLEGDEGA